MDVELNANACEDAFPCDIPKESPDIVRLPSTQVLITFEYCIDNGKVLFET